MKLRIRTFLLLAILLIGTLFRFYLITEVPPGLYPDEAANGNNAAEALRNTDFSAGGGPAFGWKIFYPENNGREGLFINLQALAIKILGAEPWALRLVSAIFGTLTVLGLYLLAMELFIPFRHPEHSEGSLDSSAPLQNDAKRTQHAVALLSAFLLATSYWHINFSRIGFRAIMVPFFAVFGMYWLLKALRTEKISSTILAGLFTGLGFHTYIAFRFMPFVLAVPILAALVSWWRGKQAQRCVPCVVALFIFIAFITALPIGVYFLNHPQDFFGRGGQVSIFSAPSPTFEFLKSNLLTLGMFNLRGDCNQRHNLACAPQLFWPVGILLFIGLALAIRDLFSRHLEPERSEDEGSRDPSGFALRMTPWISGTLLAWFLFLMLPATLTREGLPHALRTIGMIPPVMILAGLGGMWLWRAIHGYLDRALGNPVYERYHRQIQRIKKEIAVAAMLLVVWIPINTYRDYFTRFAYAPETQGAFAADLWNQGRYLARLPDAVKKFAIVNLSGEDIRGVPAPAQTIMFATNTFDESLRREKRLTYVRRPEEIHLDAGAEVAILAMNPRDETVGRALRERFPELKARLAGDILVFEKR